MAELTIDQHECFSDSPFFRSQLLQLQTTTADFEECVKALTRSARLIIDVACNQRNESFAKDLQRFARFDQVGPSDAVENGLERVSQTLLELENFRKNMTNETDIILTQPLEDFLRKEIGGVHEAQKSFAKTNDEYDAALLKYLSKKVNQPMNAINESANDVAETRKKFHTSSVEYVSRLNEVVAQNKFDFLEKVLTYVHVQHRYFHQGYELLKDLLPLVSNLTAHVQEARSAYIAGSEARAACKSDALEEAKAWYHPSKPVSPMAGRHPEANFAKEGYLLKKAQQGVAGVMQSWDRRYFGIKNDLLIYYNRNKPDDEPTVATNLRLCNVKPMDTNDRRFLFQVVSPVRTYTLQAESDEDMIKWITTLQGAISTSLASPNTNEELSVYGMTRLKKKERIRGNLLAVGSSSASVMTGSSRGSSVDGTPPSPSVASVSSMERITSPTGSAVSHELRTKQLQALRHVNGNHVCADCGREDPDWCAINLGILICIDCSGIHRSLGTHISKVRSTTLDKWEPELIQVMAALGNEAVNQILLATHQPPSFDDALSSSSSSSLGYSSAANPFDGDVNPFAEEAPRRPIPVTAARLPSEIRFNPFEIDDVPPAAEPKAVSVPASAAVDVWGANPFDDAPAQKTTSAPPEKSVSLAAIAAFNPFGDEESANAFNPFGDGVPPPVPADSTKSVDESASPVPAPRPSSSASSTAASSSASASFNPFGDDDDPPPPPRPARPAPSTPPVGAPVAPPRPSRQSSSYGQPASPAVSRSSSSVLSSGALPAVPSPDSPRPVKEAWIIAKYRDRRFFSAPGGDANVGLQECIRSGDMKGVLLYLLAGASPTWKDPMEGGMTGIHWCIDGQNSVALELLLQWTNEVEVADDNDVTPLFFAVLKDQVRVAILLVRRGASPGKQSAGGKTPKQLANDMAHEQFMALFKAVETVRANPGASFEVDGERLRIVNA